MATLDKLSLVGCSAPALGRMKRAGFETVEEVVAELQGEATSLTDHNGIGDTTAVELEVAIERWQEREIAVGALEVLQDAIARISGVIPPEADEARKSAQDAIDACEFRDAVSDVEAGLLYCPESEELSSDPAVASEEDESEAETAPQDESDPAPEEAAEEIRQEAERTAEETKWAVAVIGEAKAPDWIIVPNGDGNHKVPGMAPGVRAPEGVRYVEVLFDKDGRISAVRAVEAEAKPISDPAVEPKPEAEPTGRQTGEVKWFSSEKRYGFIAREHGEDVFVHANDLAKTGFENPKPGEEYSFDVEDNSKGPKAVRLAEPGQTYKERLEKIRELMEMKLAIARKRIVAERRAQIRRSVQVFTSKKALKAVVAADLALEDGNLPAASRLLREAAMRQLRSDLGCEPGKDDVEETLEALKSESETDSEADEDAELETAEPEPSSDPAVESEPQVPEAEEAIDGGDPERITGTVKWYDSGKGYGFLAPHGGGDDVFVHYSETPEEGGLRASQRVEFSPDRNNKGPLARHVVVISEPDPDDPTPAADETPCKGTVKFVANGYGFVTKESVVNMAGEPVADVVNGNNDVFFPTWQIEKKSRWLEGGTTVSFQLVWSDDGKPQAQEVCCTPLRTAEEIEAAMNGNGLATENQYDGDEPEPAEESIKDGEGEEDFVPLPFGPFDESDLFPTQGRNGLEPVARRMERIPAGMEI